MTVPAEEGRFQKSVAGLLERARMDAELARTSHSPRSGGEGPPSWRPARSVRFSSTSRTSSLHALNTTNWNVKETATRLRRSVVPPCTKIDRYNLRAFATNGKLPDPY
ncbi:MAG: hypothetical protein R3F17_14000 [Planctomycetota bacterium]